MAGGWLYWPLEQALHTDINYLQLAIDGHIEQLKAVFGGGDDTTTPSPTKPTRPARDATGKVIQLTPNIFDIQFDHKREIRRK